MCLHSNWSSYLELRVVRCGFIYYVVLSLLAQVASMFSVEAEYILPLAAILKHRKKFLTIIDTCFPHTQKLHKLLLNRIMVKISYSCMPNMKQIIANHNKAIINTNKTDNSNTIPPPPPPCNCHQNKSCACPLDGQWQTKSIIYQVTVTRHDNNKEGTYIGLRENTFKLETLGERRPPWPRQIIPPIFAQCKSFEPW